MDAQRDYPRFKKLIGRLCDTLGKPATDELVESWWKALRHVDFEPVESRVDAYLAKAGEKTPFPRPSQMRPADCEPPTAGQESRNHIRDYWRGGIVHATSHALGHTVTSFEPVLVAHRDSLGRAMLTLLDELEQQDRRDGRTEGQHRYAQRQCEQIARMFPSLATERAPLLPQAEREPEELFCVG